MKLFIRHEFSETSGRNEILVSLLGNLRDVPYKGGMAQARKLILKFRIDLSGVARFGKNLKKCVSRKKALVSGETHIDFCAVQKELLVRRANRRLRRFDPYSPGNNSTILTDK